jgi:glycosyltransferase involved in cell wall biosynthesis
MPCYKNFAEVFFTVQSLKLHHKLKDTEIVVVDNSADPDIEKFSRSARIRYEKYTDITGVSAAKNRVFDIAKGEYVLCMDSHILLAPGALENLPETDNFIQGPLVHASCLNYTYEWLPQWRGQMWGIWGKNVIELPKEPLEIWAMGAGFFMCRRDTWLGFNKNFRGFGGETGYIQEKYRQAGKKVICQPSLIWMHMFERKIPYPLKLIDRVINYIFGFRELNLDTKPILDNFGEELFKKAIGEIEKPKTVKEGVKGTV